MKLFEALEDAIECCSALGEDNQQKVGMAQELFQQLRKSIEWLSVHQDDATAKYLLNLEA